MYITILTVSLLLFLKISTELRKSLSSSKFFCCFPIILSQFYYYYQSVQQLAISNRKMAVLRFAYLLANIVFYVLLSTEVCASIEWNNIIKSSTLLGSSSSRNEADRFSYPWNSANRISKQFQNHAITLKDEFLRQQVSQIF